MKLIIKNKIHELDRVRDMVDRIGAAAEIDDMEAGRLNLVMEEAVSNVILYAFPRHEEHDIIISAGLKEKKSLRRSRRMIALAQESKNHPALRKGLLRRGSRMTVAAKSSLGPNTSRKLLTVRLADRGSEFDPTARKAADINLPVEERPIGGLGIHIIKQCMDNVTYKRSHGMNILTLKKLL